MSNESPNIDQGIETVPIAEILNPDGSVAWSARERIDSVHRISRNIRRIGVLGVFASFALANSELLAGSIIVSASAGGVEVKTS